MKYREFVTGAGLGLFQRLSRRWRILKHRGRYKIQRRTCLVFWVNLCHAVHPPTVEWHDTVKAAEARIEELKNQDSENTQCVIGYYN